MSDKIQHISGIETLLAGVGGVFAAGLGALGLWLANRLMGKAAFQTAINAGFKGLLDEVQADRQELRDLLAKERRHSHEAQIASSAERAQLRGEIMNLVQVVEGLKKLLRENGISVPEHRHPVSSETVLHGLTVLEQTDEAAD